MKRWRASSAAFGYGLIVLIIGFSAVYLTMPKHEFRYNPDVGISPYGMAIAKTYASIPDNAPIWYRGYVLNGELTVNANWPIMSFKVLSWWFELTGRNDIYIARLWYALLYAINALLFFALLRKLKIDVLIAFISSLCFIFLPSHLNFGSLIYADQWFITFWLLAWIAYTQNKVFGRILFHICVLLGGFLFHWFIIFLLPVPTLLYLTKRYRPGVKKVSLALVLLAVVIWAVQYGLFTAYKDSYFLGKLSGYSIWGLQDVPGTYYLALLKRFFSLGYEAAVLIPLALLAGMFTMRRELFANWAGLYTVLYGTFLSLFLYAACFVNWFGYHRHGLGMFSILIAGTVALGLSYIREQSLAKFRYACALVVLIPLLLFFNLPLVTQIAEDVKEQDSQIAELINAKRTDSVRKVSLFFDEPGIEGTDKVRFDISEFALREYTNAYTFNLYEMESQPTLTASLKSGISRLRQNGISDYDPSLVFMISKKEYEFESGVLVDQSVVHNFNVYHLDLTGY